MKRLFPLPIRTARSLGFAAIAVALAVMPALRATASTGADLTISPASQSISSGSPASYTLALSCAGVGSSSCGVESLEVDIPLDTTTTPPMTDSGWTYAATSASSGLVLSGPTVSGNQLILTLDPTVFIGGVSATIQLSVTPPNNVTPNNTSWTLNPTLKSDILGTVTSDQTAVTTATSSPQVSISQSTDDGGSVYGPNVAVTYDLTATCTTPSTGNVNADPSIAPIEVTDTLPAGMTYQSSDPTADSVTGSVADGQTVTWILAGSGVGANGASLPDACTTASGSSSSAFKVTALTPSVASSGLTNSVSFQAVGPDATTEAGVLSSANAQLGITVLDAIPVGPGTGYGSISKSALGSVPQPGIASGNQYVATFPGNWKPVGTSLNYQVGYASAMYQVSVSNSLVSTYTSDIIDPVPCLDNPVVGAHAGFASLPSSSATACAHPAFITQEFEVYAPPSNSTSPSNGINVASNHGWSPEYIPAGSSTPVAATLVQGGGDWGNWIYSVPAGTPAGTIVVPASAYLEVPTIDLTLFGYADATLVNDNNGVNELANTATDIPHNPVCPSGTCAAMSDTASVWTIKPSPSLGIDKYFWNETQLSSTLASADVGLFASLATSTPVNHDVVLTDLLPYGMNTVNIGTSVQLELRQLSQGSTYPTATIQDVLNYQGSGRELVRITIPKEAFFDPTYGWTGTGFWYINLTPPYGAPAYPFSVQVAPGKYSNTAQIFMSGLGSASQLAPVCGSPDQWGGGISPASFENDNSHDLAGDGQLAEDYCQNSSSLTFEPAGAAFSLTKFVQGDLDASPLGPLSIGSASPNGTGTFTLKWTNVAADQLQDPVVYDMLPTLCDTGVSGLQSSSSRGSQFTPLFIGASADIGIEVAYSTSSNPCRPEVYASQATCVDDWSTTPPSDLSKVTALRFSSPDTFSFDEGFSMSVTVKVPAQDAGLVAWNSAATNAIDVTTPGTIVLPAEPPKVGIETFGSYVAPSTYTLTYHTNAPSGSATPSGSLPAAVTSIASGTTENLASNPNNLSIDGYTFGGWSSTPTGTTPITTYGPMTADGDVYAIWIPVNSPPSTYTLTYHTNAPTGSTSPSGSVPAAVTNIISGTTENLASNPNNLAIDGYTFGGWSSTPSGTTPISTVGPMTSDGDVYAIWIPVRSGIVALPQSVGGYANQLLSGSLVVPGNSVGTYSLVAQPSCGTVVIHADGAYEFTPKAGFSGLCRFTYQLNAASGTAQAITTISVATPQVLASTGTDISFLGEWILLTMGLGAALLWFVRLRRERP